MISPSNPNLAKAPGINKNLVIVYVGIGISILSVIAVIVIAVTQLNPNRSTTNSNTTPTPTVTVEQTPEVTKIVTNNNAKLYFLSGSSTNGVWSLDPLTLNKEIAINNVNPKSMLSWSPSNTYLALTTNKASGEYFSFWDKANSKLLETEVMYSAQADYQWVSEEEFEVLTYEGNQIVHTSITLPNLKEDSSTINLNTKIQSASLSPDLDNIVYLPALSGATPQYLNRNTGKRYDLASLNINLTNYIAGFWLNNKDFVFYTKDGIFSLDTNLISVEQIVYLQSGEVNPLNSNGIVFSQNNNIYFVYESLLNKFSMTTKVNKVIYDLSSILPLSSSVELTVSPNEKYIALTIKDKTMLLNVANSTLKGICESFCNEVVTEN